MALSGDESYELFMRFIAGDKVYWFVDGVEKGNSASIPTATREAMCYPIANVNNASDAAVTEFDIWAQGWLKF